MARATKAEAAENEATAEEAVKEPVKETVKTAPVKKDPVFKVEKLRANCLKLFGCTTSTFDGAFYGNDKEELSIEEAKAVLNKWLGRKE